ncbi:MAG: Ig-like domain repeat protein, partial [Tepidisphaeraceae bacterium]
VQFFNGTTVLGSAPASLLVAGGSSASPTYTATLTTTLPQGNLQLTAVYSGDTRYSTSTSAILTQGINAIAVTVVVNPNYSSVTYGTPVQFTVTVTPVNTSPPPIPGTLPTPTGKVTFFDGGAALCSGVQLSGGAAVCSPAGPLAVGQHAVSVSYTPTQDQTGNINYQPNISSTVDLVVNKIPTSLSLTSSFTQGYAGQPITLTAQVVANPASGVPYAGGQVSFFDGSYVTSSNLLGVGSLISGTATLQPSVNLTPGLHQIFAVYNGDDYYTGATSGFASVTVNVAATTTQILSSVNPSVVGQTVVFTITVGVTYPSTYGPNGQVQLWDNSVALGSPVQANNGTFTITVPGLTPGTHNIFATFLANGSFSTSTSSTLTQIVNKAPTVTTLAALPVSSTSSQQVALTAVVSVPAPGAGTPTGTVQFVDTTFNKILGSAPLTMIGGVYTASITTNQLVQSGAPQLLTATYSGDANFGTSTSVPQGQTVFGTQITVTSAASYYSSNFAPDSWATAWGSNLSTSTLQSSTSPLPTSLAGSTVQVTDAAGVQRLAALSFVSMGQINFMIPTNTAPGLATITVTNAYGATASTIIVVSPTSPGLFSQDSSGSGLAAGQYIVVHSDGSQTAPNQIAQYNSSTGQWVPVPIAAAATDQVYLVLYGTGIRYKPSNGSVTATVNGQSAPVAYAGPQAQYFGEDQVNLGPLTGLVGAGTVNVVVTVNGEPSNTVT